MNSNLSSKVTEGIRVNVRTVYVRDESSPRHQYYMFAYQVEIINESDFGVQLISREWNITDAYGVKRTVKGHGVVGKTPNIKPGERHRYVSGCHFQSPIGKMQGYYNMIREEDGASLKIEIPPFVMMVPYLKN
jgi:ApaG protein